MTEVTESDALRPDAKENAARSAVDRPSTSANPLSAFVRAKALLYKMDLYALPATSSLSVLVCASAPLARMDL